MTSILNMQGKDDYSEEKRPNAKTVCANCKVHSAPDISGYFDPQHKPPRVTVQVSCLNCERRWSATFPFPSELWDLTEKGDTGKMQKEPKPKKEKTVDPQQVEELKKTTAKNIKSFGKTCDFDKAKK